MTGQPGNDIFTATRAIVKLNSRSFVESFLLLSTVIVFLPMPHKNVLGTTRLDFPEKIST